MAAYCENCGAELQGTGMTCPRHCHLVNISIPTCANCGCLLPIGGPVCPNCRAVTVPATPQESPGESRRADSYARLMARAERAEKERDEAEQELEMLNACFEDNMDVWNNMWRQHEALCEAVEDLYHDGYQFAVTGNMTKEDFIASYRRIQWAYEDGALRRELPRPVGYGENVRMMRINESLQYVLRELLPVAEAHVKYQLHDWDGARAAVASAKELLKELGES